MKRYDFLIFATMLVGLCQAVNAQSFVPHPYVGVSAELMGGGYAPLAAKGTVGFQIQSRWLSLDASAAYDNAHKSNDGTQPNPKGHDRYLATTAYLRLPSGWMAGPGARWSELSTTNYSKSAWRPTFGGAKDFFTNDCLQENCVGQFNFRISADYVLPGNDWQNGSQGPSVSFWFPSPSIHKHFYLRETIEVYRFHDTVTDRTNAALTKIQQGNYSHDSFAEFALIFRF